MLPGSLLVGLALLGGAPEVAPAHAANPVFRALLDEGFPLDDQGGKLSFPAPTLRDADDAEAQRAALRQVAGSEAKLGELLRDSVTAPFILKLRDETTKEGDLVRRGDLWFVVHADLDAIDPDALSRAGADGKPIEAGNMRFSSRLIDAAALKARDIAAPRPGEGEGEVRSWYVHVQGRLLDRIEVDATSRVTATRSAGSWVVASRTAPEFGFDNDFPNVWRPLDKDVTSSAYAGGASYVKISRLKAAPGALLVEAHFAFVEPRAWFRGAPILRSKMGLIAQDRIRRLRRELAESQRPGAPRKEE